jgi:hypothetical protein
VENQKQVDALHREIQSDRAKKRELILIELEDLNEKLGLEPRVRAICPSCGKKWNKRPDE